MAHANGATMAREDATINVSRVERVDEPGRRRRWRWAGDKATGRRRGDDGADERERREIARHARADVRERGVRKKSSQRGVVDDRESGIEDADVGERRGDERRREAAQDQSRLGAVPRAEIAK